MRRKVVAIAVLTANLAYGGQPLPKELYDTFWGKISNARSMNFNELTQNGQFAGCELVFRYPLRDYRQFSGEPMVVTGSITNNYWPGKAFSLSLKIQPNKIELNNLTNSLEFKTLTPKTASLVVGNVNLKKFERARFECSDGGLCLGYGDSSNAIELLTTIFEKPPFDALVLYSVSKTGIDLKFKLSEMDSSPASQERMQFTECLQKSLQGIVDFYNATSSGKK